MTQTRDISDKSYNEMRIEPEYQRKSTSSTKRSLPNRSFRSYLAFPLLSRDWSFTSRHLTRPSLSKLSSFIKEEYNNIDFTRPSGFRYPWGMMKEYTSFPELRYEKLRPWYRKDLNSKMNYIKRLVQNLPVIIAFDKVENRHVLLSTANVRVTTDMHIKHIERLFTCLARSPVFQRLYYIHKSKKEWIFVQEFHLSWEEPANITAFVHARPTFSEHKARYVMFQLSSIVHFLHSHRLSLAGNLSLTYDFVINTDDKITLLLNPLLILSGCAIVQANDINKAEDIRGLGRIMLELCALYPFYTLISNRNLTTLLDSLEEVGTRLPKKKNNEYNNESLIAADANKRMHIAKRIQRHLPHVSVWCEATIIDCLTVITNANDLMHRRWLRHIDFAFFPATSVTVSVTVPKNIQKIIYRLVWGKVSPILQSNIQIGRIGTSYSSSGNASSTPAFIRNSPGYLSSSSGASNIDEAKDEKPTSSRSKKAMVRKILLSAHNSSGSWIKRGISIVPPLGSSILSTSDEGTQTEGESSQTSEIFSQLPDTEYSKRPRQSDYEEFGYYFPITVTPTSFEARSHVIGSKNKASTTSELSHYDVFGEDYETSIIFDPIRDFKEDKYRLTTNFHEPTDITRSISQETANPASQKNSVHMQQENTGNRIWRKHSVMSNSSQSQKRNLENYKPQHLTAVVNDHQLVLSEDCQQRKTVEKMQYTGEIKSSQSRNCTSTVDPIDCESVLADKIRLSRSQHTNSLNDEPAVDPIYLDVTPVGVRMANGLWSEEYMSEVHFSAFGPPIIRAQQEFRIDIWAYLKRQHTDMLFLAKEFSLTDNAKECGHTNHQPLHVRRGALVTISLEPNDFFSVVGDDCKSFRWTGDVINTSFDLVKKSTPLKRASGYMENRLENEEIDEVVVIARIVSGTKASLLYIRLAIDPCGNIEEDYRNEYGSRSIESDGPAVILNTDFEIFVEQVEEIAWNELELIRPIGSGSFGQALLAEWKSPVKESRHVVVKQLHHDVYTSSATAVNEFRHEAAVMNIFGKHPHVVELLGICSNGCESGNSQNDVPLSLVTEYLSNGSVQDIIRGNSVSTTDISSSQLSLPSSSSKFGLFGRTVMARDAAHGIVNIHQGQFLHRDIAARNCLVDDQFRVKVCDFGLSRKLNSAGYFFDDDKHGFGPLKWMAPESLVPPHLFSTQSDSYMFGVLMYEIFSGELPFPNLTSREAIALILEGHHVPIPSFLPFTHRRLMHECFDPNPLRRPSLDEIFMTLDVWTKEDTKNFHKLNAVDRMTSFSNLSNLDNIFGNKQLNGNFRWSPVRSDQMIMDSNVNKRDPTLFNSPTHDTSRLISI